MANTPNVTARNIGVAIFAIAIFAIGCETIVYAGSSDQLDQGYRASAIIPWLPPIPWLAVLIGGLFVACSVGLFFERTARLAALTVAAVLVAATLVLGIPRDLSHIGSISLRTSVFEPLAIAALALMLLDDTDGPSILSQIARYALALSLVVFGVDHFLAIGFIATLLPAWLPWHVALVAFFGACFIAAGLSIAIGYLQRWAFAGMALMFATWVVTLHGPRVLGLYAIPGAPQDPAEWQSLFIAIALCGGFLTRARPVPIAGQALRDAESRTNATKSAEGMVL